MVDKKTKDEIQTIFDDWKEAVGIALSLNAEDIAYMSASSTLQEIAKMRQTKYTKAFADGVTDDIVKSYKAGIKRGGSYCVEPVYEDIGGGMVRASTRRTFIPWLDDFAEEQRDEVMRIFIEGERAGAYPLDMAEDIEKYFEGTKHRAQTAARTESQKIAQDARIESYKKSDVKYVQYITAADEKVRPEHEARNMKVYPIAKAPEIGEYNCRCILTEADFLVEEEGFQVEEDDVIYLDADGNVIQKPSTEGKEVVPDGYNDDRSEYKGFAVEQMDPNYIRPPNEPTDYDKYERILASMEENGYQGRPIIVIEEFEDQYYGLTGSHRLAAATEADLDEIPVIKVPTDGLSERDLFDIVGGGGSEDYVLQGLRYSDLDEYAELVEEDLI